MEREDCREYFAAYTCNLLNGAYSTENVANVLEDMHQLRKNEMLEYIEESIRNPELPEIGEPYLEMQMDCIRAWAETAPESMLEGMRQKWQLGEVYTLYLQLPDGEGATINDMTVTEPEAIPGWRRFCRKEENSFIGKLTESCMRRRKYG